MKKHIALIAVLALLPSAAFATNKISSPDVTQGQVELEYRAGYDIDDSASRDDQQGHKFVANYGITDRWRTEVKASFAGERSDMQGTYLEWSNRWQVFKADEAWMRLSVQENYKFSLQSDEPDVLEVTLLAAKDIGKFAHVINVSLDGEIGSNNSGGTGFDVNWKTKYKWKPEIEPGIEIYGDFGKITRDDTQKYLFGPVISGKLPGNVKYDTGILLGLNDDTVDTRLKLILTYAF